MFYGLDVHKSFIQVCRVHPRGRERYDFTIGADHDAVAAFAQSLSEDDAVVLRPSSTHGQFGRCSKAMAHASSSPTRFKSKRSPMHASRPIRSMRTFSRSCFAPTSSLRS